MRCHLKGLICAFLLAATSHWPAFAGALTPDERFKPGAPLVGWERIDLAELLARTDGLVIQLRGQKVPFSSMLISPKTKEVALRSSGTECLGGRVEQFGVLIRFRWDNGEVDFIKPMVQRRKIRLLPYKTPRGVQHDFIKTTVFVKKPFQPCAPLLG